MNAFKQKYGPWALVTGASSGIGMEFARQLAARGLNLVLVARRETSLNTLADELGNKYGVQTRVVPLDLSREDFLPALRNATADLEVGLLVNNAGATNTGPFVDNALEDELQVVHLNCRAPLILAHEYGKQMKQRQRGGMIFVASVVAFASVPDWANYAASKAYNLMLAEALSAELKAHHVDVLALCPGFTRTGFVKLSRINELMSMEVHPVVSYALRKLGRSGIAIPGIMNKFSTVSTHLLPRFINTLLFGLACRPTQQLNR